MIRSSLSNLLLVTTLVATPVLGANITVSMQVDDAVLASPGAETTLRVFASVSDTDPNNGIYAYALNLVESLPNVVLLDNVVQLGNPDLLFSSTGVLEAAGVQDVYGGDGGFFMNQDRGIVAPFELLNIRITGLAEGVTEISAGVASSAAFLGIDDGFLLQQPGAVNVDFGVPVSMTVLPEPGVGAFLALTAFAFHRRRRVAHDASA